jgi:hypothetical protein
VVRNTFKRFLMMSQKTLSLFCNDDDFTKAIALLVMDTDSDGDNEAAIQAADVDCPFSSNCTGKRHSSWKCSELVRYRVFWLTYYHQEPHQYQL